MSKVTLNVDGTNETKVFHCHYSLNRNYGETGKPNGAVHGGVIQLEIDALEDSIFFGWMVTPFERKNGSIKFYRADADAVQKELHFQEGHLVSYSESFSDGGSSPLRENLVISARIIEIDGARFENPPWD